MFDLKVNGKSLLLRSGTEATVEHVNPLFADGIEDSYSTPFEVPTDGNEEALGHVHELSLAQRELSLPDAELHNAGQRLHRGALTVLASTPDTVRTSFSIDAFVETIRGLMLPDLLRTQLLELDHEGDENAMHDRPRYAEGGNCQFPMFLNPSQYGDERPTWNPSQSTWSATQTYDQNDLVSFTERTTIERTWVYQCIDAGGTLAGESPTTAPSKWRRASYGLVNAWDAAEGKHYLNTESANFYTWVPWFYVKWVIRTAMEELGFRVEGSWMDDEASHELLLPNTTTIDSASEDTGEDNPYFFRAHQTDPVAATASSIRLPAQAETPLPSQDPDSLWNTSTYVWTVPAAGGYRLKARTTLNRYPSPTYGWTPAVRFILYDTSFGTSPLGIVAVTDRPMVVPSNLQTEVTFDVTFGAGDIGRELAILVQVVETNTGTNVLWPRPELGDQVTNTVVSGWVLDYDPGSAQPDSYIWPHRHVPHVEFGAFLVAWCDAYNLKFTANMQDKVVRLDLRERELLQAEGNTTEQSQRTVGTPELDHERRTTGMVLRWDLEDNLADNGEDTPALAYYSEDDLQAPASIGQRALIRSTRKLLRSAFVEGNYVWRQVGYHVPAVSEGDPAEATEVVPALRPVHMEQVWLDGKEYLVPKLDEQGTSAFYHGQGDQNTIWACVYAPARSGDGAVTDVPGARSWGYGWDGNDRADTTLLWDSADAQLPGIYQHNWQGWVAMLLAAEPVTWDLAVDMPFLLSKEWQGFMHLHGHRYLCERLPVSYRTDRAELVSRGAYLLKLRPWHPQALDRPLPSAVFTNEAVGNMEAYTSTGYVTIQNEVGERYTFTTADPPAGYIPIAIPAPGTWRIWSSDIDGEFQGTLLYLLFMDPSDPVITDLNPSGLATLEGITIVNSPITSLNVAGCTSLRNLGVIDCALAEVDSIFNSLNQALAGGTAFLLAGTTAAPTSASLAARTALAANGWTISTN